MTDHHVIDVPLIRSMQEPAQDKLTILPGIELRSELGGSESVHYTGIFSENCDLEDVWIKLQGLGITAADVQHKGDQQVYVPFTEGCKAIRDRDGIVVVHAGSKSNSIEGLSNADEVKKAVDRSGPKVLECTRGWRAQGL